MRRFALLTVTCFLVVSAFAQQVTGNVKDQQGKALSNSTVSLLNAKDSSIVKLAASNNNGSYSFNGIKPGNYIISISHVGYVPVYSQNFEYSGSGDFNVPALQVNKISGELKEVIVNSKKPMVEVKADKTVLNVEGTINSVGTDALELLRKSPGVMVDKDDNLSLAGKNGVQIYIDGRPTPLTGKDLSDYLKSIQSTQIESIEIITNPSAKYDAAGNAGIINIRLKKNKSFGTNGSVNAGYGIGIYPKYNGGLSLNHRNSKVNIFGNYTFNDNINESSMKLHRELLDTLFDQQSKIYLKNVSHGYKGGVDYFVNKFNTVGVIISGNSTDMTISNYSRTPISYIPTGVVDRILVADNSSKSKRNNTDFNLNYRFVDTSGHELNVDADYGFYRIKSNQLQPNYYFDPVSNAQTGQFIYNMIAPTNIDMYTAKADYEQNFKKGRLGLGVKTSYVKSGNDFERYNIYTNNTKQLDTLRSNGFNYKENINAVYANYNRSFKGFMIQAGLRVENTNSQGRSLGQKWTGADYSPYDSTFNRHYTDFFPSAALTYNKNPMNQWSVSYSRRIDRPAYQDLNPFEFKLDEYTYQKGNTMLRPQYTNSFGLTNTYKFMLTSTLNYSHVKDVFTQLIDTADVSKSFITKKNLATQDIVSLNVSYPFHYKWYTVFANVNTYYSRYKADFGGGNRKINLDVVAATFFMQNSFNLGKGYTGELSGWYSTPSIWQGTFKSSQIWSVDGGVQKTLFKGKANIKASVSDIFKTIQWKGTSNFSGQQTIASGGFDSRVFKINFTYRFGNNNVKASRQRKTGLEDENKRVGSQGGGLQQ
ncbi:MAG: TonB-dependent receptor [Bacteroidetes bacterium]|nr:TonB-dependent receptor [Bacteroidota bacterium]